MLFTTQQNISNDEVKNISDLLDSFDNDVNTVTPEETQEENCVYKYLTSLANGCYAKSVEAIANTDTSNKIVRKRNLQQVMRESFFYGANRFGNNFIA